MGCCKTKSIRPHQLDVTVKSFLCFKPCVENETMKVKKNEWSLEILLFELYSEKLPIKEVKRSRPGCYSEQARWSLGFQVGGSETIVFGRRERIKLGFASFARSRDGVEMRSLTEGSPPPSKSDDQNLDVEITERRKEEEEEKKKKKKVAYLRDTELFALYPSPHYKQWTEKRRKREGFAHQFVSKLEKDISKRNSDQRQEEIYLKEFQRYLKSKGMADLVSKIKSSRDIPNLPAESRLGFLSKTWYFNNHLNHEVADEYQLLSLGDRRMPEEVIPDVWQLNNVGNALKADLQYQEFFSKVFKELQWDDTEEQGVRKTIAIRDKYFPNMNDRVIPWLLCDWAVYKGELYTYSQTIDMFCQLWAQIEEGKFDFSEVPLDLINEIADKWVLSDFEKLKMFLKETRLGGRKKSTSLLIKDFFEATLGEPKPNGGDYLLFVKEKIRMALKLGIIQKEDVKESEAGSQLLKNIEDYDPCIYSCYDPR